MNKNSLIVILGATASGKTRLATQIAAKIDAEIISADSRQIFKHMNIGTGKDLQEYTVNGKIIPYHLIDILEPGERYHVDAFKNDFYKAYDQIINQGKNAILCGGTGLYIQNVLQNFPYTAVPVNEELRLNLSQVSKEDLIFKLNEYENLKVDFNSIKRLIRAIEIADYLKNNVFEVQNRPALNPTVFGLKNEVNVTRANILKRLEQRLENGMIEEVVTLLKNGLTHDMLVFYGLEYKFISSYLLNEISLEVLKERLGIAICQYAKRQNTYFRKMEKDGIFIHWINAQDDIQHQVSVVLNKVI